MLKTLKILLVLTLLISLAGQSCLAITKKPPSSVFLGNNELSPRVKFIERNSTLYINHLLLEETFKDKVEWRISNGLIKINFTNFEIEIQTDHSLGIFNEKKYPLNNLPFEQGEDLWLSLEFYKILGIIESSCNDEQLRLTWEENYLLNINVIQFQGRPALELILTGTTEFKNFLLTKPDRLVCQFPAFKVHPVNASKIANLQSFIIKKAHFNTDDTGLLTLVFKLSNPTGYHVIRDPNLPERFLIFFNYYIEDISLFHQGAETKVNIKTSAIADFKVIDNSPLRLTVQFYDATLKTHKKIISGDGDLIKEINVEQISPEIIQLNLTLLKTEELFVTQSRDNPNLIQIRKVQLITGLEWTNSGQGSELIITGDGELLAMVQKVKNTKRVQLDLDYAQFQSSLIPPNLTGDQGKSISLSALNSHQVRLEIDLNYILSYKTEISPNQRQLRVSFQHSPLLKKTFVIDPGHGGPDKGASGRKGTLEKEINLDVALRLKNLLEEAGANVVLTRFDDTFISLYERAFLANFLMADFFLSIHTNSHLDPQVHGIEAFYYPNHFKAWTIASKILNAIVQQTGLEKLAAKSNNFVVIRETQMTGALLELGFLSNLQEELILRSDQFKDNAAEGVFQGIIDFFN